MKVLVIDSPHISGSYFSDILSVRNIHHMIFPSPLDFFAHVKTDSEPFFLVTEIFTSLDTGQKLFYDAFEKMELKGVLLISKYGEDIIHSTKSFLQETKVRNIRAISGAYTESDIIRNINRLFNDAKKNAPIIQQSAPGGISADEILTDVNIRPYCQPKVCAQDEVLAGYEVLSRLKLDNAIYQPHAFIHKLIEQNRITEFTLKLLKITLERFASINNFNGNLSFNIDYQSLSIRGFADQALAIADRFSFPCERLVIEVTENDSVINANVIANLTKFRIKGCKVSIDDFGMNHSGFTALLKLPFTEIKIDRSYIQDIVESTRSFDLVKALSSVAASLGNTTVAEGIETQEQREKLRSIHIDYLQGYLYGKPFSIEDLSFNPYSVAFSYPKQPRQMVIPKKDSL